MFHPGKPRSTDHGFTLLEALVAVFIVSVVMTFSLPTLIDGMRSHAMISSSRTAVAHLRLVRGTAIARGAPARLVVEGGTRLATDVLDDGVWTRVGRGVALDGGVVVSQVAPAGGIVFEREGTLLAPGAVTLENAKSDQRTITVSILGAIEVAP